MNEEDAEQLERLDVELEIKEWVKNNKTGITEIVMPEEGWAPGEIHYICPVCGPKVTRPLYHNPSVGPAEEFLKDLHAQMIHGIMWCDFHKQWETVPWMSWDSEEREFTPFDNFTELDTKNMEFKSTGCITEQESSPRAD